jgi:CheY-like chemotaxis protein
MAHAGRDRIGAHGLFVIRVRYTHGLMTSKPWILVAEDDPRVLDLWTEALTDAGYRILSARNGRDAFALMRSLVFHCIVLDLRMPEVSGADLLKLTRGAPVLRQIPVIVVSGFLDEHAEVLETTRLNVVRQIEKPVVPAEIVRAVAAALSASPAR